MKVVVQRSSIGGTYTVYWIIDFDEGYAYFFTDRNGNEQYDKCKIVSGTFNDVAIVKLCDDSQWGIHFKRANQPDHLVEEDHYGYETDFYPTNLNSALRIKNKKTEIKY